MKKRRIGKELVSAVREIKRGKKKLQVTHFVRIPGGMVEWLEQSLSYKLTGSLDETVLYLIRRGLVEEFSQMAK